MRHRTAEEAKILDMRKAGEKAEPPPKDASASKGGRQKSKETGRGPSPTLLEEGGRADRLVQHEFLGAVMRLGAYRAKLLETEAHRKKSLGLGLSQ